MDYRFRDCLSKRHLLKIPVDEGLVEKELKGSEYDLGRARNSLAEEDYKWGIVQSYYSIFHAVKALVFSKGYREKRHYCRLIAFKALFVDEDVMEDNI
ncbi:MAG: HEPN domain-containing protein [Candidatus Altiarchaeales archaeon]|nr:HEPN domain-containing protein [Candidatus Altiarchaeales archaeon]